MFRDMTCSIVLGSQTCVSTMSTGSFKAGFCGETAFNSLTSVTIPGQVSYGTQVLWSESLATLAAPLIQLNWKSSDISPSLTLSENLGTTLSIQASIQSPSPTALAQDSSLLSSGGRIAIGVGVPLGALAVAFLAACLWLRYRRRKQVSGPEPLPELQEIEARSAPQEMTARKWNLTGRHELQDAKPAAPELADA